MSPKWARCGRTRRRFGPLVSEPALLPCMILRKSQCGEVVADIIVAFFSHSPPRAPESNFRASSLCFRCSAISGAVPGIPAAQSSRMSSAVACRIGQSSPRNVCHPNSETASLNSRKSGKLRSNPLAFGSTADRGGRNFTELSRFRATFRQTEGEFDSHLPISARHRSNWVRLCSDLDRLTSHTIRVELDRSWTARRSCPNLARPRSNEGPIWTK